MKRDSKESHQVEEIIRSEREWIKERRNKAGNDGGDPAKDAVGLALSGGGIRSATFNLGILQALEHSHLLKSIDYLSTVSGGGYIGSAFTWLKSRQPDIFPFGTKRKHHSGVGGKVLYWLRGHGRYLIPGDGLNVWVFGVRPKWTILDQILRDTFAKLEMKQRSLR